MQIEKGKSSVTAFVHWFALSYLNEFLVVLAMLDKVLDSEPIRPLFLVKVQQHLLFQLILSVIDCNGVVVSAKSVNEGLWCKKRKKRVRRMDKESKKGFVYLNGGFVQMSNVGRRLAGLLTHHHQLRINQTESVDDDFSFHRLNRIHDDSNGSLV